MSLPFTESPAGLRLALRVTPKAGVDAVGAVRAGRLQVKVAAPPEDGKATAAALKLVARACGLPVSRVVLVSGATSREKLVLLTDFAAADLPPGLQALLAGS